MMDARKLLLHLPGPDAKLDQRRDQPRNSIPPPRLKRLRSRPARSIGRISHIPHCLREVSAKLASPSPGCPRGHPPGRRTGWSENEPAEAIGQVVSASAQLDVIGRVPEYVRVLSKQV